MGVVEARLAECCDLMRTARFRTGKTAKELAKKWGLGLDRTYEITAEASRIVAAELKDPERVTVKIGAALERIIDEEMAKAPNRRQSRNVIEAGKVLAVLVGANAAEKHDVKVAGVVDLESVSRARETAKQNEE